MAEKELKQIVRLAGVDLDGRKFVAQAIRKIPGISFMFSNAIVKTVGFRDKKLGELSEEEIKKLEDIISNPQKYAIPSWLYNRRKEPATGVNKHLVSSQLDLAQRMDISELKKIRCYRGVRHSFGLPVRGQRTRGSFRKGITVGVKRGEKKVIKEKSE